MSYIDGWVIPVPKRNLDKYKQLSRLGAKVWVELGAEEYVESIGDDLKMPGLPHLFPKAVKAKPGEVIVFGWITYKDKRTRDRVNKAVMQDPRIQKAFMGIKMPFDEKRMVYGGFKTIVENY